MFLLKTNQNKNSFVYNFRTGETWCCFQTKGNISLSASPIGQNELKNIGISDIGKNTILSIPNNNNKLIKIIIISIILMLLYAILLTHDFLFQEMYSFIFECLSSNVKSHTAYH